jgi:hypothetical protein
MSLPRTLLLSCLVLCAAAQLARAEVFTNKREAEHFEASVSADRLVVRERYHGATTIYGNLACPLGPAVRAVILPPGTDGRVCLHFARDKCEYTRFQDGTPVHNEELANAVQPRMCIALAGGEQAKQLAALVNAGPRLNEQPGVGSTGSPAAQPPVVASPGNTSASRTEPAATTPQQQAKAAPSEPQASKSAPSEPQASKSAPSEPQQSKAAPSAPQPQQPRAALSPEPQQSKAGPSEPPGKTVTHGSATSGAWVSESFVVGPSGNRRITERTYASAYILDDKPGRPPGRYLYIKNKSNRHLLFYSLCDGPQIKLEPGAETVMLVAHGPAAQRQSTHTVTLLWFARN